MKIVAYSATLLFAASVVCASPVAQQQQQPQQQQGQQQGQGQQQQPQQQQQQQCTMDMLQGYMITSPVNFVAQPQEVLPERGQFIDATNTTILVSDQQGVGDQNKTSQMKFNNQTEISTEILQNSIFAISWMSSNQRQQAQQQKINPVRVQLVSQDGELFNVTETLGVLSTGGQQQQQQQAGQQQGNQTATPQVQASQQQQQQGSQPAVTQPEQQQGNQTSQQQPGSEQRKAGQEGAIVVSIGPEIKPGMYAFLLSAQVQPQQQQQQQQQGPLCKIMTIPFRVRSVSDLQQKEGNATATRML